MREARTDTDRATEPGAAPALQGLRVVEFSAFVAAPLAGLTLAQWGAEVVRIDPPGGNIDIGRLPLNAQGRSLYWASLNRGKRSIELDMRSAGGRELARRLITAPGEGGGIFVTNLAVEGELSYESLVRARRDLIMVQLVGSPDGANALDYTVNAAVGFPYATGPRRAAAAPTPVNHLLPAWDLVTGATIAAGVLAAERHRRVTGKGQLLRIALSDVAMAAVSNLGYLAETQVNGDERLPDGNFVHGAYGDAFLTRDGRHVMVVAISDRQWRALIGATGLAQPLEAAAAALGMRLDDEAGRYEARELISAFLKPWFARRSLEELGQVLSDRSILWGPYRSVRQMLAEDPRCSPANPMFAEVEHPGYGRFLTSGSPLRFGGSADVPPAVAPRLGEHTEAVLREWLGITAKEERNGD